MSKITCREEGVHGEKEAVNTERYRAKFWEKLEAMGSRVRAKDRSHFLEEGKSSALKQGTDEKFAKSNVRETVRLFLITKPGSILGMGGFDCSSICRGNSLHNNSIFSSVSAA